MDQYFKNLNQNFKISVNSMTYQPKFIFISSAPIAPSIYNTHTKIYHYSHMHLIHKDLHPTQNTKYTDIGVIHAFKQLSI
jgi:hypothetical protein